MVRIKFEHYLANATLCYQLYKAAGEDGIRREAEATSRRLPHPARRRPALLHESHRELLQKGSISSLKLLAWPVHFTAIGCHVAYNCVYFVETNFGCIIDSVGIWYMLMLVFDKN